MPTLFTRLRALVSIAIVLGGLGLTLRLASSADYRSATRSALLYLVIATAAPHALELAERGGI